MSAPGKIIINTSFRNIVLEIRVADNNKIEFWLVDEKDNHQLYITDKIGEFIDKTIDEAVRLETI